MSKFKNAAEMSNFLTSGIGLDAHVPDLCTGLVYLAEARKLRPTIYVSALESTLVDRCAEIVLESKYTDLDLQRSFTFAVERLQSIMQANSGLNTMTSYLAFLSNLDGPLYSLNKCPYEGESVDKHEIRQALLDLVPISGEAYMTSRLCDTILRWTKNKDRRTTIKSLFSKSQMPAEIAKIIKKGISKNWFSLIFEMARHVVQPNGTKCLDIEGLYLDDEQFLPANKLTLFISAPDKITSLHSLWITESGGHVSSGLLRPITRESVLGWESKSATKLTTLTTILFRRPINNGESTFEKMSITLNGQAAKMIKPLIQSLTGMSEMAMTTPCKLRRKVSVISTPIALRKALPQLITESEDTLGDFTDSQHLGTSQTILIPSSEIQPPPPPCSTESEVLDTTVPVTKGPVDHHVDNEGGAVNTPTRASRRRVRNKPTQSASRANSSVPQTDAAPRDVDFEYEEKVEKVEKKALATNNRIARRLGAAKPAKIEAEKIRALTPTRKRGARQGAVKLASPRKRKKKMAAKSAPRRTVLEELNVKKRGSRTKSRPSYNMKDADSHHEDDEEKIAETPPQSDDGDGPSPHDSISDSPSPEINKSSNRKRRRDRTEDRVKGRFEKYANLSKKGAHVSSEDDDDQKQLLGMYKIMMADQECNASELKSKDILSALEAPLKKVTTALSAALHCTESIVTSSTSIKNEIQDIKQWMGEVECKVNSLEAQAKKITANKMKEVDRTVKKLISQIQPLHHQLLVNEVEQMKSTATKKRRKLMRQFLGNL